MREQFQIVETPADIARVAPPPLKPQKLTVAAAALRDLVPFEKEVKTKTGRWLLMRLRPYRTVEDRTDGIVVSFIAITQRLSAQKDLRQCEERYRQMVEKTATEAKALTQNHGHGSLPNDSR